MHKSSLAFVTTMAFFNKAGNILRQTVSNHINQELSASNPSILQAIRCMSSSKLFVGGLSYSTDDVSLREAFSKYGQVVDARVIVDRESGRSKGFGFVTFCESLEASAAIQALDGQELHGRRVRVNYANDRARGPGYGSGGFSTGGYGAGGGYVTAGSYGGSGNYSAGGNYGAGGNYVPGENYGDNNVSYGNYGEGDLSKKGDNYGEVVDGYESQGVGNFGYNYDGNTHGSGGPSGSYGVLGADNFTDSSNYASGNSYNSRSSFDGGLGYNGVSQLGRQ